MNELPHHVSSSRTRLRSQSGGLSLLCGLICLSLTVLGFGFLAIQFHWHRQVTWQLKLDRCVAETGDRIRGIGQVLDADNGRIEKLRIALASTTLLPQARAALQAALALVVGHQELTRVRYLTLQTQWLIRQGCGDGRSLVPMPLSELAVLRDPPDALGSRPLRWLNEQASFSVQLNLGPRGSRAQVTRGSREEGDSNGSWSLHWAAPVGFRI